MQQKANRCPAWRAENDGLKSYCKSCDLINNTWIHYGNTFSPCGIIVLSVAIQ